MALFWGTCKKIHKVHHIYSFERTYIVRQSKIKRP